MRCICCNSELTDFEATRRSASTNDFLDICDNCLDLGDRSDFELIERYDLRETVPIDLEQEGIENE